MHMSNPPTAQAASSGTEVTDSGTESESSSHSNDQSNDDARTGDDTPADGREMTREDEPDEAPKTRGDGSRLVDDEFRKDDDPTADEDDERDAWGRREVGIDWPLPPESRLPMDC